MLELVVHMQSGPPACHVQAMFQLFSTALLNACTSEAVQQIRCTAAVQRVPAVKDLPAIVSAMLVKPIPPALDASGEGLFTTVIPDNRCMSCGVPKREQAAAQHGTALTGCKQTRSHSCTSTTLHELGCWY